MILYALVAWGSAMSMIVLSIIDLVTISDLECDFIDTVVACKRLNYCFAVEVVSHVLLTISCLIDSYTEAKKYDMWCLNPCQF
ncbi:hypothetical protein MXB_546 [Myxobolus squamalis]|nr:hypothetical protein MXB_546 [Myxobolus squamalis]